MPGHTEADRGFQGSRVNGKPCQPTALFLHRKLGPDNVHVFPQGTGTGIRTPVWLLAVYCIHAFIDCLVRHDNVAINGTS